MEKQIVFRSVGPNLPYLVVLAGFIQDGQFKPEPGELRRILEFCNLDQSYFDYPEVLGRDPVIARSNVFLFLTDVCQCSFLNGIDYYDSFIVFKFGCYGIEEEKAEKE